MSGRSLRAATRRYEILVGVDSSAPREDRMSLQELLRHHPPQRQAVEGTVAAAYILRKETGEIEAQGPYTTTYK